MADVIDEFAEWKIEQLAKAIDWLTARVSLGLLEKTVMISEEDWNEFQKGVQRVYDAKESDVLYHRELPH